MKPGRANAAVHATLTLLASGATLSGEEIVNEARVRFPHTRPGEVFEIRKVLDAERGTIRLESTSVEIESYADLEALVEEEHRRLRDRYGRIHGGLRGRFEAMTGEERVPALVYLRTPPVRLLNKLEHPIEVLKAGSVEASRARPTVSPEQIASRYGLHVEKVLDHNAFVLEASRRDLESIRFDDGIAAIEEYIETRPVSLPFTSLVNSAYNPPPLPADSRGFGVHAATFEIGLWQSFVDCLGNLDPANIAIDSTPDPSDGNESHSQKAFDFLWLAAPDATLYHRNSLYYGSAASQQYLADNGIESTSMSYTRFGDQNGYEFLVMDGFAYRYPYTNFVNPTANDGYDSEVHWQCHNCISVGNVRHTDEQYYELQGCTQTRNPDPIRGSCIDGSVSPPCAGDREMPHLVAPGFRPSSSGEPLVDDLCLVGHQMWCGTSFSAPVLNGIVADVISADPRMRFWPEKVRVALLLTAHNVDGDHWDTTTDGRDGAGVVSGADAVWFAKNHTAVLPGGGAEHGLATGAWYANAPPEPNTFWVHVPQSMPRNKHLRVVLAWDSNPDLTTNRNALSDLDLWVWSDGPWYFSSSWDSNVEIVDIPAEELTPGQSYPLHILLANLDIPAGASTDFFYWSIGWTWVRDRADAQIQPDRFEPNEAWNVASDLGVVGERVESGLTVHAPGNDDYYRVAPAESGTLYVDVLFSHELGDVDLIVQDGDTLEEVGRSTSVSDDERVTIPVVGGESYFIRVYGYAGATHPGYILSVDLYTGASSFCSGLDKNEFCWGPVPGATQYEVRRSSSPAFEQPCAGTTTSATSWVDSGVPLPGEVYYYLSRAVAPTLGSWGTDSSGNERGVCQ